jgi:hypothetical protein
MHDPIVEKMNFPYLHLATDDITELNNIECSTSKRVKEI